MKCLVFDLGSLRFGIPINNIERIVEASGKVFSLPLLPKFISGITNYQGRIITVIDLGLFLNSNVASEFSLIVISNNLKHLGYSISKLEGFVDVSENDMEDIEKFNLEDKTKEYLKCIAKTGDNRFISIIDFDKIEVFFQNPKNWSYYEV